MLNTNTLKPLHEEATIKGIIEAEVINPKSTYFGESLFVTHRSEVLNEVWYKANTDYEIGMLGGTSTWFKSSELEFPI